MSAGRSDRPRALVLDAPRDNVAVALTALSVGEVVRLTSWELAVQVPIPFGHKLATRSIRAGDPVIKYGETIGIAAADIAAGEHVHVHNVTSSRLPGPSLRT
jgi:altronate dehydratase